MAVILQIETFAEVCYYCSLLLTDFCSKEVSGDGL